MAAAVAATLTTAPCAVAAPVCGDVNVSGKVTAADALAVLKHAVGQAVELLCEQGSQPLKTGQTACHDADGAELPCASTGHDGDLQMGAARTFTDNGDGTITDHNTGLVWEKLSDDDSIHDWDNSYTWADGFATKVGTLNSAAFAGHSDWRMPNRFELETLVHIGAAEPSTYSAFNNGCAPDCTVLTCSCTESGLYWSSSTYHRGPSLAWLVFFKDGDSFYDNKTDFFPVRAVRSNS